MSTGCCQRFKSWLTDLLKEEFQLKHLLLYYESPQIFYLSRWQSRHYVDVCYVIYRTCFCLAHVICLQIYFHEKVYFYQKYAILYLTYWSLLMSTFHSVVAMFSIFYVYNVHRRKNGQVDCPWFFRFQMICNHFAAEMTTVVTIAFFGALRPSKVYSFHVHFWGFLVNFMEFWISSVEWHLLSYVYSFFFAMIYLIFAYSYYKVGGLNMHGQHYIYKVLNWQNLKTTTLIIGLVLVLSVFVRLFYFSLSVFKIWLAQKIYERIKR